MTTIVGHRRGMVHGSHLYGPNGEIIYSDAAGHTKMLAAPAAGNALLTHTGTALSWLGVPTVGASTLRYDGAALAWAAGDRNALIGPTGCVVETLPRWLPANVTGTLTSGTLYMVAVPLLKGQPVANISWFSATAALSAGSNQWSAVFDSARVKRAISADATSGAWAANTKKTFAMTTPYVATADGLYYLGLLVVATTVPTLAAVNLSTSAIMSEPPILTGAADASLTNPASCPNTAAAITAGTKMPYAFVT